MPHAITVINRLPSTASVPLRYPDRRPGRRPGFRPGFPQVRDFLGAARHVEIARTWSQTGSQQAVDQLSTRTRHAHSDLRAGLRLDSVMEFDQYIKEVSQVGCSVVHFFSCSITNSAVKLQVLDRSHNAMSSRQTSFTDCGLHKQSSNSGRKLDHSTENACWARY